MKGACFQLHPFAFDIRCWENCLCVYRCSVSFCVNCSMAEEMVKFLEEQGPEFWAQFESDDFGEDGD